MIAQCDLRLARRPHGTVTQLGREGEPLLVFDGVMEHPQALVELAVERARFSEDSAGHRLYPGLGAPAPAEYVNALAGALDRPLRRVFGLDGLRQIGATSRLSLVTKRPEDLEPLQCVPHIDTTDALQFALLHYLCGENFGGTGFFRHRQTGFETITADRAGRFAEVRGREMAGAGSAGGYISGDTLHYEKTGQIDVKFDRLVVYRSCLLHSGMIPHPQALSADPRLGRLTANIFVTYG